MLELRNLAIQLQGEALFSPVNLIIDAGEVVTLMGPSGSGKSTILSAIAGDLDPAFLCAGDILLGSQSLHGVPMERRHIGLLYQDDLLFPHMNVGENLGFALPQGLTRSARQERINEHLALAGLHNYARRDVASLSGGQRARVSVLRTLLAEPQAVLLDEPFSKLDRALRGQFREWVFATLQARQVPALQVTHDTEDAAGRLYDLELGGLR